LKSTKAGRGFDHGLFLFTRTIPNSSFFRFPRLLCAAGKHWPAVGRSQAHGVVLQRFVSPKTAESLLRARLLANMYDMYDMYDYYYHYENSACAVRLSNSS
jgi:hypothetical protein